MTPTIMIKYNNINNPNETQPIKALLASGISELNAVTNIFGIVLTIPAMINNETPLPIPLSVIWSPNHNKNAVPAVNMIAILKYSIGA